MFYNLKKLIRIIKISDITNILFLFFLIFISSFFEILSIGILVPLVSIIVDPEIYIKFTDFLKDQKFIDLQNFIIIDKKNFILLLTSLTFFLYLIKFLINIYYNWFLNSARIKYENIIGLKILKNYATTINLNVLNTPTSKLFNDLNSRVNVVCSSIINMSNLIVEFIVFVIIYMVLLFKFPSQSIYLFFFILFVFIFIYFSYRKIITSWSLERGKGGDKRNKNLLDFFSGIREVIVYFSHQNFLNEFSKNNKQYLNPQKKILFLNSMPKIILEFIFLISILSVFFYYVYNDKNHESIMLSMSVFLVLTIRLLPSFNRIIFNFNQFKYSSDSISKVHDIMISTNEFNIDNEKVFFKKNIILKDIFYKYDKENLIFENLNFKISKQSKVGIIGETGSGKSTFLDLLIGFLKPLKGQLFIDDKIVESDNFKSLLKNISYVPQKVFLFNSSIRENITFKNDSEKIDDEKFDNILNFVELKEFVKKNEKKEFFSVGEFGSKISGGQRQKIGIARALYKDTDLLIFDESTNALDEFNEKKIIENLLTLKGKTIIFVTHNHNNLHKFDSVFKINNKKLSNFNL